VEIWVGFNTGEIVEDIVIIVLQLILSSKKPSPASWLTPIDYVNTPRIDAAESRSVDIWKVRKDMLVDDLTDMKYLSECPNVYMMPPNR